MILLFVVLLRRRRRKTRRHTKPRGFGVREIFRLRQRSGEFHNLVCELRLGPILRYFPLHSQFFVISNVKITQVQQALNVKL